MKHLINRLMTLCCVLCLVCTSSAFAAENGSWRLDWDQGGAMGIDFIWIDVDPEASVMSLWPCDTVTDVVLESLDWSNYAKPSVLWSADRMTSQQVLNIRMFLLDVMPALRVTCTNPAGQRERFYITDSGEDGSLLLMPAEEFENWITPEDTGSARVAEGTLIGTAYYASGDELGNLYEEAIGWTEDGTNDLVILSAESHSSPVTYSRYSVPSDTLPRIAALVKDCDLKAWTELPVLFTVCDAPQPYFTYVIEQEDGTIVWRTIDLYADLTEEIQRIINESHAIMLESRTSDRLLERYTFEQ